MRGSKEGIEGSSPDFQEKTTGELVHLYQYQGFWYSSDDVVGVMYMQERFKVRKEDVFLVSFPKSGTTWLKSVIFSVMNRSRHDFSLDHDHRLQNHSPHELVPFLEYHLHQNIPLPNLETLSSSSPHLFSTHIPFTSLPKSVIDSQCRIVYICRDPKDVFVSTFSILPQGKNNPFLSLEDAFDMFCR